MLRTNQCKKLYIGTHSNTTYTETHRRKNSCEQGNTRVSGSCPYISISVVFVAGCFRGFSGFEFRVIVSLRGFSLVSGKDRVFLTLETSENRNTDQHLT